MNIKLEERLPHNSPPYSPNIEAALKNKPKELVIDMKDKRLLYVSELRYFQNLYHKVKEYGGKIKLTNPSKTVRHEFEILHWDKPFGMEPERAY